MNRFPRTNPGSYAEHAANAPMSPEVFAAFGAGIQAEADRAWRARLCAARGGVRSCPCERHVVERALLRDDAPSAFSFDLGDPAFQAVVEWARAAVQRVEDDRRASAVLHVAIDFMRRVA